MTLTSPTITMGPGASVSAQSVSLAGGGITEAGSAVLAAQTLTSLGAIGGSAALGGTGNAVGRLAGFAAGDSLTLTDSTALTLSGVIAAPRIVIDTEGHMLTLTPGATIETNGEPAPTGVAFNNAQLPSSANAADAGAFFTVGGFTQTGRSDVLALGAATSVLRVTRSTAAPSASTPISASTRRARGW